MDRGTKGEVLLILFVRIFLIVSICCLISRLITKPEELEYWYDFVIFVLGVPTLILFFGGETAKRKKCIKKGQKFAAKLINVDEWDRQDGGRKYTDLIMDRSYHYRGAYNQWRDIAHHVDIQFHMYGRHLFQRIRIQSSRISIWSILHLS